ncbi:hypothetical protein MGN70_006078 [Eutypa lata]|nr:hypothetical protein MGN70_006078 [Eutypa lata]
MAEEDMGLKNYSTDLIQLISTSNARLANSCQNHHLLLIRHATASKSNNPRRIVAQATAVPPSAKPAVAPPGAPTRSPTRPAAKRFTCSTCKQDFKNTTYLERHKSTVHLGPKCYWGECREEFNDVKELSDHVLEVHQRVGAVLQSQRLRLLCRYSDCGRSFTLKNEFVRHTKVHIARAACEEEVSGEQAI